MPNTYKLKMYFFVRKYDFQHEQYHEHDFFLILKIIFKMFTCLDFIVDIIYNA